MTQYPGPDPDDPFAKPPNESGTEPAPPETPEPGPSGVEETAPIQREEMGYWERKALEDQARTQQEPVQPQSGQPDPGQPAASPYGQPPVPPPPAADQPPAPAYGAPDPTSAYGQQQPGYAQYPAPPATGYQAPYGQQPYNPGYVQPYGYGGYQRPHPQAQTAMVLGLVGLIGGFLCCGLLFVVSPFAWSVGAKAKREIAASQGQLGGGSSAQAGFVMGIIGTALLVLALVAVVVFFLAVLNGARDGGSSTTF